MPIKIDYTATREELIAAKVAEQTRSYKPVSHEELITMTTEGILKAGFEIDKEIYTSSNNCQVATARYVIKNVQDAEMGLMVGWQNSYNKAVSLKFAMGTHIFMCTNGCISSNMGNFKRKHTGDVQVFTPATIDGYLQGLQKTFECISEDRDRMKDVTLSPRDTAELLGRIYFEEEILTSTQLNIVKDEIKKPTHDYKAPQSMWELYNYVTYALKEVAPKDYFTTHMATHEFFMEKSGFFDLTQMSFSLEPEPQGLIHVQRPLLQKPENIYQD